MKKIFFFCFLMLGATVTFNACGDEDNKPNTNQGADDKTPSDDADVKTVAYVTGNNETLVLNMTTNSTVLGVSASSTTEWTCKFDAENKLTSSVKVITYPNAELANAAYREFLREKDADDQTVYNVVGNKLTIDDTAERKGQLRQIVNQEMNAIANLANNNQRPNSNDSIPGYVVPQDSVPGHVIPNDSTSGGGYVEPGDSLKPIIPIDTTDVTPIVNRTTASVKYSSNYMTLTIDNGQYQSTTACEFAERGDQNVCIKATQIYFFIATGQRQEEDYTEDYAGRTFEEILAEFQAIEAQVNNQSNGEFF